MTGEMFEHDVTEEAFPLHFAMAAEFNGTVEPFDVYQGPYVSCEGGRLFIGSEDGTFGYVFNDVTGKQSETFPLYFRDQDVADVLAVNSAKTTFAEDSPFYDDFGEEHESEGVEDEPVKVPQKRFYAFFPTGGGKLYDSSETAEGCVNRAHGADEKADTEKWVNRAKPGDWTRVQDGFCILVCHSVE